MISRLYMLDLLRFCAIMSVVLNHYTNRADSIFQGNLSLLTEYCYPAIYLSFMISGFSIALSARGRTPLEFAISRFVRLYPLYWFCMLMTALTLLFVANEPVSLKTFLFNLTMMNGYLGIPYLDGAYWTLHVELKFYFLVFVMLALGLFQKMKLWLGVWLAITICHMLFGWFPTMGWFINPNYSCFFIAGCCFSIIYQEGKSPVITIYLVLSLLVSLHYGMIDIPAFITHTEDYKKLVVSVILISFYIAFLLMVTGKISVAKSDRIAHLGALTYPLYLVHNALGKAFIDHLTPVTGEIIAVILVFLMVLALAVAMNRYFVEKLTTPLKRKMLSVIR